MSTRHEEDKTDAGARARLESGDFVSVSPALLESGDVFRRSSRPDRIIATIAVDDDAEPVDGRCWRTFTFAHLDGAPSWHRTSERFVCAARPGEKPIRFNTGYQPGGDSEYELSRFGEGQFAWVPGKILLPGDNIDSDHYAAIPRTVASVSDDRRTITLAHDVDFENDDSQMHGTPATFYYARREGGVQPTQALALTTARNMLGRVRFLPRLIGSRADA